MERAAQIIDENEGNAQLTYARLDREGLVIPDLPEPSYGIGSDSVVWTGINGDKVTLDDNIEVGVTSRDRTLEQARDLAYRILAAVQYAESH